MKFFSNLYLHVILTALAVGTAIGCHTEGIRPLYCYPVTGLAIGLGIGVIARFVILLD